MTEEKAIELATKYQKERGRPSKLVSVHRITQAQIDAFVEGRVLIAPLPEWTRLEPHWVVSFDREWDWYVHGHFPCGWKGKFPKGP